MPFCYFSPMKIQCWSVGKSHEPYVKDGIEDFTKRINKYYPAAWTILPPPKNAAAMSEPALRKKEGENIMTLLQKEDYLVVLDERGKMLDSPGLGGLLQHCANNSTKNLVFLIGGAYGTDEIVLSRANFKWSLSKLVFPHQLVRLILAEQLYRACSILRNEKYHHT
jgi:23S rRNA (pseudouridine1915-N3)-methyltransferase